MARTDHMAVPVSDMDAAIQFYAEKLGLQLIFREVDPVQQEEFAFFNLDGGNLELLRSLVASHEKPVIKPPYCPHIALATDDMTATLKLIHDYGIPIVKGPLQIDGKVMWLYVADPDNNVIEFVQWLEQ